MDYPHISLDSAGVPVLTGTHIKVVEIVLDHLVHDSDAEEIHPQFLFDPRPDSHALDITTTIKKRSIRTSGGDCTRLMKSSRGSGTCDCQEAQGLKGASRELAALHGPPCPWPLPSGLRARGIDVRTALEDGRADVPDEELLARATELGCIVFTQDDDFLAIADNWQRVGPHFAGVVYAHQLRATVGQIVADLHLILKVSTADELRDYVLFLPLRR